MAPMTHARSPRQPALRPFVALLWASRGDPGAAETARELSLPTGAMHIAIRLGDRPLRLYDGPADPQGRLIDSAVLNGVRRTAFCKAVGDRPDSVGAVLCPGAADPVSQTPAGALAGRHTALRDLWPPAMLARLRERLEATASLDERLAIFEAALADRVAPLRAPDPIIAHALRALEAGEPVGAVVAQSGFCHRHIARLFTEAVGVAPKAWAQLRRFNRAIGLLHAHPATTLADAAAVSGYTDQAHMTRAFRDLAGITPAEYRRAGGPAAGHVPLGP